MNRTTITTYAAGAVALVAAILTVVFPLTSPLTVIFVVFGVTFAVAPDRVYRALPTLSGAKYGTAGVLAFVASSGALTNSLVALPVPVFGYGARVFAVFTTIAALLAGYKAAKRDLDEPVAAARVTARAFGAGFLAVTAILGMTLASAGPILDLRSVTVPGLPGQNSQEQSVGGMPSLPEPTTYFEAVGQAVNAEVVNTANIETAEGPMLQVTVKSAGTPPTPGDSIFVLWGDEVTEYIFWDVLTPTEYILKPLPGAVDINTLTLVGAIANRTYMNEGDLIIESESPALIRVKLTGDAVLGGGAMGMTYDLGKRGKWTVYSMGMGWFELVPATEEQEN